MPTRKILPLFFVSRHHPLYGTAIPKNYCPSNRKASWPIGYGNDPWNQYNYQGGLDLALFVFDHFEWTRDAALFQRYASRAVQFHSDGGQSDFSWLPARTSHGGASYMW